MKLTLKFVIAAIILSLVCFAAEAQPVPQQQEDVSQNTAKPKWVSDLGFWVVEGNVNNPKENVIYFYNNNKVQVYKEVVSGERLKLNKRRTLMMLKKTLETAVIAWQQNKPINENEKLFIAALDKK